MKSSLILGYGSTGQDIEQYLISQNKNYLIHDDLENIDKKYKFNTENINNIETIFVSPGVKKDHEILRMASSSGIKIMTDIELFSEINNVKLIGVTGTNGKTSFVTLLDRILNKYDIKSKPAGNIGNSPLNLISDSSDLDYLILELSSFQLTHMNKIELEMAVVLNIYQDHIDWHETFEQYVISKLKIFDFTLGEELYKKSWSNRTDYIFNHISSNSIKGLCFLPFFKLKVYLKHLDTNGQLRKVYSYLKNRFN